MRKHPHSVLTFTRAGSQVGLGLGPEVEASRFSIAIIPSSPAELDHETRVQMDVSSLKSCSSSAVIAR